MKKIIFKKFLISVFTIITFIMSAEAKDDYPKTGLDGSLPVFYRQLKDQMKYEMSWTAGSEKDFAVWKDKARKKVFELLLQKTANIPFDPKVIDQKDRGKYTAKKVIFNLTENSRVMGLLLVPKGKGPFPAVVLYHDHGAEFDIGKEKMIEPWGIEEEKIRIAKEWSGKFFSNRFVGDELAKRGYIVLAVDALGWGDRGRLTYEIQQALASNMFNLGTSLAGLMAYEDVRSAEFLASMPEVNKAKIAAFGFSMGSFRAWQAAALTDVISCGIGICWMTTAKGIMAPGNNTLRGQSAYFMLHPGLFNYLDFPDVASIACPKPMLFYNGDQDKLFPADSVNEAYEKMKAVWASQNASEKLETKIWTGLGHTCIDKMQDEAFIWLDKWMKAK